MAGKKKEVILQASITTKEQWDEMLAIKGLTVVDVYQQWCGPCRAVVSLLRKMNNELGDHLLHFATAEADSIEALERYRGKCEPTFLFYGGGHLVRVLRGASAPLLHQIVLEELVREKLLLESGEQRQTKVEDGGLLEREEEEEEEEEDIGQGEVTQLLRDDESMLGYTLAIIKPDAVTHGNAEEIKIKLQDAGFQIIANEERVLGEQVARDLYHHKDAEPFFEELVQFMTSGLSHILLLSRPGGGPVVQAWLDFMGPRDVEEARRVQPLSLRAQFGTATLLNAVHGSEDTVQVARETALLLPAFLHQAAGGVARAAGGGAGGAAGGSGTEGRAERTLALIRPTAARGRREEVLCCVAAAGLRLALSRELTLSREQVAHFYRRHDDHQPPPALLLHMTSGPVLALVLSGEHAVQRWRDLLGPADVAQAKAQDPRCLRAVFAMETEAVNQLHGSATTEDAQREIDFFFPIQRTLALLKPDAVRDHKEEILEEIRKAGFSAGRQREEVLSREEVEELYQDQRGEPFFSQLLDFLCGGPSLALELTKENAVEAWRALMGPADPAQARAMAPGSLRARFSSDVLRNAVHGPSSAQRARDHLLLLLGDAEPSPRPGEPVDTGRLAADA